MNKKAFKWILQNTKFCFLPVSILSAVNALFALISLTFAYLTKLIVDSAAAKEFDNVVTYGSVLVAVILVSFIFRLIFRNMDEKFRVKANLMLKSRFFENIITRKYSKITEFHTSDLQNRMFSDIFIISNGIMTLIPSLADILTTVLGAFIMLVMVDASFALIYLAAGIVILSGTLIYRNKIKKMHKNVQEKDSEVRSFVQEALINLLAVKVFNTKGNIQRKNKSLLEEYKKSHINRAFFMILTTSAVALIFEAGFVYALLWGAMGILAEKITYGTLAQVLQLTGKVQGPVAAVSSLTSELFRIIASVERLMEIEEIEADEKAFDCSGLYDEITSVEFENVTFSYDNENVLENASFRIDKNTFVSLIGTSGIGKSTVLKLMLGVLKPQSGKILIRTPDKTVDVSNGVSGLFSYVPQGNLIFSGTIKENICFISENISEDKLNDAVCLACVDEFCENLPCGLDTVIGEKGTGLSEGQIQRIAIARAILSGNRIFLLDEATSALDAETERKLITNLKSIKDITVIAVTHKQEALEVSDKVFKIEDKKVYEEKCINE